MVSSLCSTRGARLLRGSLGFVLFGLSFTALGCSKRSDDVREWRVSDHDRGDEQQDAAQNAQQPEAPQNPPAMPSLRELGISDVTLAAWKTNCTVCHGLIGRGDGPQGAMLRPTDLTNPEWQKKTPDDEIRQTITKGRGRMPAFSQLPPDTVEGLVKFVRLLNSERPAEPEGAPAGATAPASTAPGAAPAATPSATPASPHAPSPAPTAAAPHAPTASPHAPTAAPGAPPAAP